MNFDIVRGIGKCRSTPFKEIDMTAATALFALPIVTFASFALFAAADLRATMIAIKAEDHSS